MPRKSQVTSHSIYRTPSKAKNLGFILLYCNIISITYLSRIVTYVSKLYEHCRNAEVSLRKNRLQGGNVLRQNRVRNKWSMRKYTQWSPYYLLTILCWEGRREWGSKKGRRRLQGRVWFCSCGTSANALCASLALKCCTYSFFTKACLLMVSTTSLKRIFEVSV